MPRPQVRSLLARRLRALADLVDPGKTPASAGTSGEKAGTEPVEVVAGLRLDGAPQHWAARVRAARGGALGWADKPAGTVVGGPLSEGADDEGLALAEAPLPPEGSRRHQPGRVAPAPTGAPAGLAGPVAPAAPVAPPARVPGLGHHEAREPESELARDGPFSPAPTPDRALPRWGVRLVLPIRTRRPSPTDPGSVTRHARLNPWSPQRPDLRHDAGPAAADVAGQSPLPPPGPLVGRPGQRNSGRPRRPGRPGRPPDDPRPSAAATAGDGFQQPPAPRSDPAPGRAAPESRLDQIGGPRLLEAQRSLTRPGAPPAAQREAHRHLPHPSASPTPAIPAGQAGAVVPNAPVLPWSPWPELPRPMPPPLLPGPPVDLVISRANRLKAEQAAM
jgi:hypothetical protein